MKIERGKEIERKIPECIQKFPDWVDNEINNNNKHSLSSNTKGYSGKLTRLTHETAIQLHLVAESYNICSSPSRRPVRKLLDTYKLTYLLTPRCKILEQLIATQIVKK